MSEPITEERFRSVVSEMRQWKNNHAEEVRKKQEAHRRLTEARGALQSALDSFDDIATLCRGDAESVARARKRALAAAGALHEALRGEGKP